MTNRKTTRRALVLSLLSLLLCCSMLAVGANSYIARLLG